MGSTRPPPRRNKLSYKDRWLISRDVVAALRRAGVACNIIVPDREERDALQYVEHDTGKPVH
jgi:hypothetical protein